MYAVFIHGIFLNVLNVILYFVIQGSKELHNHSLVVNQRYNLVHIKKVLFLGQDKWGELTEMRSHHFRFPDLYQSFLLLKKYLLVVHISRMGYIMSK